VKEIERRLISELMKNSRRSDRKLAEALRVSQPTVSRAIRKIEKEGYIQEYTAIPDFNKIGFELLVVTVIKFGGTVNPEDFDKLIDEGRSLDKKVGLPIAMVTEGLGNDYDMMIFSFHENYSSYAEMMTALRKLPFLGDATFQTLITNLKSKANYRNLTFSALADYLNPASPQNVNRARA
jgi:DNA-binding Lrp family transcriptional regulator